MTTTTGRVIASVEWRSSSQTAAVTFLDGDTASWPAEATVEIITATTATKT